MSNLVQVYNDSRPVYFDNDCISSFLWVQRTDIVESLYSNRIFIPDQVLLELSFLGKTKYNWVYTQLLSRIGQNTMTIADTVQPAVHKEFVTLTTTNIPILGKGEAAALSLAVHNQGVVACNNYRDIIAYCKTKGLRRITTDYILCEACSNGLITFDDAIALRHDMVTKYKRVLGLDPWSVIYAQYLAGTLCLP